jgi:hypothetical protein
MDEYKVEDFEVVREDEPVDGCSLCWFYQAKGFNKRCTVVNHQAGFELEKLTGGCETGFHYTLKNNTDGQN